MPSVDSLLLVKLGLAVFGTIVVVYAARASSPSARFTADSLSLVITIAEKVVLAVEQAHGNLSGGDKKKLATEAIKEISSELHIQVPPVLIEAAIEAAVLTLRTLDRRLL